MSSHGDEQAWTEAMHRFRFVGQATLALALLGWLAWFWPLDDLLDRSGTPLGGDYIMLYVAGQVVAEGQAQALYDDAANQMRSSRLVPQMNPHESWPYRYPPTVAAVMQPLSWLPLGWSYVLFALIQLSLLALILWLMQQNFPLLHKRPGWLWAIGASPLVLETIIGGQSSLLGLTCVMGFLHFWRRQQDALAGMALALALYKPNVAALLILAAIVVRPRILVGLVPTACFGLSVAVWATSPAVLLEYVQLGTRLASTSWMLETPYWKVHGLAPFFQQLWPDQGKLICGVTGLTASLLLAISWRQGWLPEWLALAAVLCGNALFNPYVPIYDLVLLSVPLLLVSQAMADGEGSLRSAALLQLAAATLLVGPHLSQALARPLGWQIFPWLLSGWLVAGAAIMLTRHLPISDLFWRRTTAIDKAGSKDLVH